MISFLFILLISICSFILGLLVLFKNKSNWINITFASFAFTLAVWTVVDFLCYNPAFFYDTSFILKQIAFALPPIGLFFLLLFSLFFTKHTHRRFALIISFIGIVSLLVSCLGASRFVLAGIEVKDDVVVNVFGPLTIIYMLYLVMMVVTEIRILSLSLKRLSGQARARTVIMAASLFIMLVTLVVTNMVLPLYFGNYSFVGIGLFSTVFVVTSFTYAIIKLRLFDIRIVVARSITYAMLLVTLGASYAFITFKIGGAIFHTTSTNTTQQTFNIATALVLAFTFQPLQHFFERITDKVFYKSRYDPEKLINKLSVILASEIELSKLSRRVRLLLSRELHVAFITIVVLDDNRVFAESGHYVISQLQGLAEDLAHLNSPIVVADELPDCKKKDLLHKHGISMFVLLKTKSGRVGYLLLGHKLSGDVFSTTDVSVIGTISGQLAVAIENAKSYTKIQNFNNTLQSKINEATQRLRDAYATLQQLDKVKDEFLSMASHQLRTPLTISDGFLGNVIDGAYGKLKKEQSEALKISQSHLHMTIGIVSDLLNISRMDVGKLYINYEEVDLLNIVQTEIEHLKTKAVEHNVKLTFKKPSRDIPIIKLDKQKTQQAVLNLISNAISYSENGHVKVSLDHAGNQLIFRVDDDGIGVADEEKDKLFTKFYRAENAKLTRPDGTGIGLYLVKRVIEDQGGTILFESSLGKGSTFGFRVPTKEENKYVVTEKS